MSGAYAAAAVHHQSRALAAKTVLWLQRPVIYPWAIRRRIPGPGGFFIDRRKQITFYIRDPKEMMEEREKKRDRFMVIGRREVERNV